MERDGAARQALDYGSLLLALGVLYASVVPAMVHDWATDENYSHGFLIPVISGYLLWARREEGRWPWSGPPSTGPARLTTGPMCYFGPTVSPDGRTLFALGRPPGAGGELVRYDARGRLFAPFLDGRSIRDVEFSRDGAWIAYVRHPDGTLWRSRADGTGGLQLSFSPHTASLPRWSPDGRRIAYTSLSPDGQWEVRVVAAEAGEPQAVPAEPDLPRPRRVSSSPGAKLCPWA